jgi:hypothetical protein
MHGSKPIKDTIPIDVNLSADQCPKTQEEEEDMSCNTPTMELENFHLSFLFKF